MPTSASWSFTRFFLSELGHGSKGRLLGVSQDAPSHQHDRSPFLLHIILELLLVYMRSLNLEASAATTVTLMSCLVRLLKLDFNT